MSDAAHNGAITYRDGHLRIAGDMTIYSAAALRDELLVLMPDCSGNIEVNLSEVSALDTAGLQIILMMRRFAQARGATFCVSEPSAAVLEVIELSGMQRLIDEATGRAA